MNTIQTIHTSRFRLTRRKAVVAVILVFVTSVVGWRLWPPPPLPILARWRLPGKSGYPLVFSPDGTLLATGNSEHGFLLWDLATKTVRTRGQSSSFAYDGVFSPNGQTLAVFTVYSTRRMIRIVMVDMSDGTVKTTLDFDGDTVISPRFSSDGEHFSVITYPEPPRAGPWKVRSWTTSDWAEEPVRSFTLPTIPAYLTADVAPDGRTMVTGEPGKPGLTLWNLTSDPPSATLLDDPALARSEVRLVRYSADGAVFTASKFDGTTEIWDLATKTRKSVFPATIDGYNATHVEITPDHKTMIAHEAGFNIKGNIFSMMNNHLYKFSTGRDPGLPMQVVVRDLATERIRAVLNGQGRPTLSADGKVLATSNRDGTLTLWDLSKP
jgi:WD40 repeat protein